MTAGQLSHGLSSLPWGHHRRERCRLVHHLALERFEIPMNVLDFGASTEIFGGQAGPI